MVKKKISKTLAATTAAATFGAAMTSMYVAPEMQADIVDLTFNGGNATASNPYVGFSSLPVDFDIDQVPNVVGTGGDFAQWNDTFGGSGRTLAITGSAVAGNLSSIVARTNMGSALASGDTVDSNLVFDTDGNIGGGTSGGTAPNAMGTFDGSGTAFVAFRTAAGNFGWYQLTFTVAGPIVYGPGQLGTMGEAVSVGGGGPMCPADPGDINGDGMVDLLDVTPFVDLLVNGTFACQGDINGDGVVDLLDVTPFVDLLTGG